MAKSYLGAYWGPRTETVEQSADRLAELVARLVRIDPLLAGWRAKARTKREALAQPTVAANHADLVGRLLSGRNRRDDNGEVIDELGYSIYWWNGSENDRTAVNLSINTGATAAAVSNRVLINLPDPAATPQLYETTRARELIHTLITLFEPDSAVWTNRGLVAKQRSPGQELEGGGYAGGELIGHAAGWANYLSDRDPVRFNPALIPNTAIVERVGNGTLVMLGDDAADPPLNDVLAVRAAMGYAVPPREQAEAAGPAVSPTPGPSAAPAAKQQERERPSGDQAKPTGEALPRPSEQ